MDTPDHTPARITHAFGDAAMVGNTLFMPDGGTAGANLSGGDARMLNRSIQRVLSRLEQTRLFMCHDYGPNGRHTRWQDGQGLGNGPMAHATLASRRSTICQFLSSMARRPGPVESGLLLGAGLVLAYRLPRLVRHAVEELARLFLAE